MRWKYKIGSSDIKLLVYFVLSTVLHIFTHSQACVILFTGGSRSTSILVYNRSTFLCILWIFIITVESLWSLLVMYRNSSLSSFILWSSLANKVEGRWCCRSCPSLSMYLWGELMWPLLVLPLVSHRSYGTPTQLCLSTCHQSIYMLPFHLHDSRCVQTCSFGWHLNVPKIVTVQADFCIAVENSHLRSQPDAPIKLRESPANDTWQRRIFKLSYSTVQYTNKE